MRKVSVLSVRYDGSPRDRFDAELLDATNGVYRVGFAAGTAIETPSGIINEVRDCTQILFADRWYNVNQLSCIG